MRPSGTRRSRLLVGRWDGVPIYADWSLPLGLVVAGLFAGVSAGSLFGYFLVILVHEIGHVTLIRRYRFRPTFIFIHAFGGECRYDGHPTAHEVSVIAWGGVLAQAALCMVVYLPVRAGIVPYEFSRSGFVATTVGSNLCMAALNLLPFPGLDGEHAWRLFRGMWREQRRRAIPPPSSPKRIADELVEKALRGGGPGSGR